MADFTVFVQHPDLRLAVAYYEFYGMDGPLRITRPIRPVSSFLNLLEEIVVQGNQMVIIVSHGNPNGLVMRLVPRKGAGNATSDALSILLKVHVVQERVRELNDRRGKRQPEDWFPILNLITTKATGNERPIDILVDPPQNDTAEVQKLRRQIREAREKFAKRRVEAGKPSSTESVQDVDDEEQAFLDKTLKDFEAKVVEGFMGAQAAALGLQTGEVQALIAAMDSVHKVRLKRVLIRGCNLGKSDDERTMSALCYFLGAEILDAPRVYTIFGPLNTGIGERRPAGLATAAKKSICGEEDVRRKSGCWWAFEVGETAPQNGTVRIHIEHRKGVDYTAVAHAPSVAVLERWVQAHFGNPPNALRAPHDRVQFPIHFLLTAPAVFPRDGDWTRHMRRVLGLQRGG